MEGLYSCGGLILVVVLALACFIAYLHRASIKEHRGILEWTDAKQRAREEAEEVSNIVFSWHNVASYFPFLPFPEPDSGAPDDLVRACAARLSSMPSLGTFSSAHLPAPALPSEERRRHLYVVGKTGSGKTT